LRTGFWRPGPPAGPEGLARDHWLLVDQFHQRPTAVEQAVGFVGGHRLSEIPALHLAAAQAPHGFEFGAGLRALGGGFHAELVGQCHDCLNDRR
jgi:hypothetical protein